MRELSARFPGWHIGSVWASAASGPNDRRLCARKGTILITAATAAELAADIRHEETRSERPP